MNKIISRLFNKKKIELNKSSLMSLDLENQELIKIFQLFFDELPYLYEIKNTSRDDADFREAIIAVWTSGEKYVIKLSDNDFTFPEKIETWKRCTEEYQKLGYYCPTIFSSKFGNFPTVMYKGHNCVVYVEEFCKYSIANERLMDGSNKKMPFEIKWLNAAWIMTAKVAAKQFDFCNYPSGYCLFETFCPSEEMDEVLENAIEWKKYADNLPGEFQTQVQRIWERWVNNRNELEQIYHKLPTSVFQADLNPTNLLLDANNEFVGVFDFNLCGRDVFLNYLFREIHWRYDDTYLLETLKKVSQIYNFSDLEIQVAPLLYRCLKPLWYTEVISLKKAGNNRKAIQKCLDKTEKLQTINLPFKAYMSSN